MLSILQMIGLEVSIDVRYLGLFVVILEAESGLVRGGFGH